MQEKYLRNVPLGFNSDYYYNIQNRKLYLRTPNTAHSGYTWREVKTKRPNSYYLFSYDGEKHHIRLTIIKKLIDPDYNFNNYIPVASAFTPYNYQTIIVYLKRHHYKLPKRYRIIDPNCRYVWAFKQSDLDKLKKLKQIYIKTRYDPRSFVTLKNLPQIYNYYYDPDTDSVYSETGRKLKKSKNNTYSLIVDHKRKTVSIKRIRKLVQA